MASFYNRQVLDDMEDELPFDLNPGVPTNKSMPDSFVHPQLAPLKASDSNPPLITLSSLINAKFLAKSQVPPRPKPPVPSEYFVYPKRSWRCMTKEQVRMHLLDRYAAKQRYMAAYQEWEEKHSKWVFGIYHLVRAVTKSQRREMKTQVDAVPESAGDDASQAENRTTTVTTDVIGDLDVGFGTTLTVLQEGAEADELDRVKRWWTQVTQPKHRERKYECSSTPLLPILHRQGNEAFGSRGSGSRERHGTPDIELPHQAARKIHSSMSSCVPPKQLPGQKEASMSEGEGDDDQVEEAQESLPSWRIYSDQCACGYSGCHCRSWMRWWDKTFQMLKYVEYVDLPVSTLGVSGIPTLGDELLDDPTMRYSRVSVGERLELVKREPLVRSLHKIKSPKSKKRPWSFKELKSKMNVNFPFCVRLPAKQGENQGNTLSAQSLPRHIFKVHWEDFVTHPKIPGDYINAICRNISQKSVPLCIPRSVAATHQWPTRNRALQLIAYIQYTYRLPSEIFFLAINLLDRYIAGYQQPAYLTGTQWDLVGLSCLWLAWKYENHTSLPPLDDLITHSQLALITRKDVIFAEWTVRRTIGLDLFYTNPLTLARLELLTCPCTRETKYVARFLAEVSTTVRSLARCPPTVIGYAITWLACILTDVPVPGNTQHYIQREKAVNHQAAMFILMGVLYMPRPIERPREQALFYKWTLPIVSNIAEWCQQTLEFVWPNQTGCAPLPHFDERLLDLGVRVRSKPFELGSGPYPEHPLFEA